MKKSVVRCISICLCFVFVCAVVSAQDEAVTPADRFVISAKAGGINFVEGTVAVVRKEGKSGRLLKGDTLQIGDRVSTGADGKAEILLNPGSFLRLGGNSAFEFKTTSLDDLQLRLHRGSAILEVFAAEEFKVLVHAPKAKFHLIETGVFRVDILDNGDAKLEVWKGYARAGRSPEYVKAGRVATVTAAGGVTIAKFDRDEKDSLDLWSKARGKELAKLTAKLKRNDIRASLMRSFRGRGWDLFGSFGLWVYDPFYGGYVFLPFGRGWYSPYGYGFGHYIGWYDLPPVIWYPHTGGGGSSTGGGNPTSTPIVTAGPRNPTPPFVRIQETMGGGIRGGGRGSDSGGSTYDASQGSSPSYSAPPASSAPTKSDSSPAPTKQP